MGEEPLPDLPDQDTFRDHWIKPNDARALVAAHVGADLAPDAILKRVAVGRILTVAETVHWREGLKTFERDLRYVAPALLTKLPVALYTQGFWNTGDVELEGPPAPGQTRGTKFSFIGVRFDPVGFASLLAASEPSKPASNSSPSRRIDHFAHLELLADEAIPAPPEEPPMVPTGPSGAGPALRQPDPRGAPPKTIFEDALLAVAHKWHLGDFKPSRQADVQRELEQWLSDHGAGVGTTSVKERAKKLWNTFKD